MFRDFVHCKQVISFRFVYLVHCYKIQLKDIKILNNDSIFQSCTFKMLGPPTMHQLSFWPHHQFETVKLACCVEWEGRIYPIYSLYNPDLCFIVVVKMSGRLFMFYARTIIDFSQYSSGSLVNKTLHQCKDINS